jgi:hypothetical protein
MKFDRSSVLRRSIPFGFLSAIVLVVAVACGNSDEPAQAPTVTGPAPIRAVPTQTQPSSTAATAPPIVTNDMPVPGSTDGVFSVNSGSEATFTVNEKLASLPLPNDAVMRTSDISGEIDLGGATASLVIDLHSLTSDQSRRDGYIRNRLFPQQPQATISVTQFPDIPEIFADGESFSSTVVGTVNVNGVDADIEFEIESRLDPDRLLVLVKGDFTWANFGMTAPTSRSFVVKDDVHVEVLISATPK